MCACACVYVLPTCALGTYFFVSEAQLAYICYSGDSKQFPKNKAHAMDCFGDGYDNTDVSSVFADSSDGQHKSSRAELFDSPSGDSKQFPIHLFQWLRS